MDIYYISNNQKVIDVIIQQSTNNINFKEYRPLSKNFVDADVLLIVEPIHNKLAYLSIFRIWKKYLKKDHPNIKLLVAGFHEVLKEDCSNYIDLLKKKPNLDWYNHVKKAKSTKEEWAIPIESLCMSETLEHFFDGHGGEDSLMSILIAFRMTLNIAHTRLGDANHSYLQIKEDILTYAFEEWRELYSRWKNYYPLFNYLPFYSELQGFHEKLAVIADSFNSEINEEQYKRLNLFIEIDEIQKNLNKIYKWYVKN